MSGRRRWLISAAPIGLLLALAAAAYLSGSIDYVSRLIHMQRLAALVYPGSRLVDHQFGPAHSSGTQWEVKAYQTADSLNVVIANLAGQTPGFVKIYSPVYHTEVYVSGIAEQTPADWIGKWFSPQTTPRGVSVEVFATSPITPGTTIKIKTTWYEP
jgi:hypothetical protein